MKNEDDFILERQIKRMIDILFKVEKENKENDSQYSQWINEITQPNYGMISIFVKVLSDESTKQDDIEKIFLILRKLLFLNKENVKPQLDQNTEFESMVIKYILTKNIQQMTSNSFYFLTLLFKKDSFKPKITKKMINSLFSALNIIQDEDILITIINFLISIENKEIYSDLIYKVHKRNPNSHFFNELLLKLLHTENNIDKVINILICINKLMTSENSVIFYEFDLECFIDIIVDKLNSEVELKLKIALLQSLAKITEFDNYYSKLYKIEEITELMEDYQGKGEHVEELKKISKQIIVNIMEHQLKKQL